MCDSALTYKKGRQGDFRFPPQLHTFLIGSNGFPVEAQQQYLRTHEACQRWLTVNLQYWAETQSKAAKKTDKRGLPR